MVKLALCCPQAAPFAQKHPIGIELLHNRVSIIGHKNVALRINRHINRPDKLTIARSLAAPTQDEIPGSIKLLDAVVPLIHHIHIVLRINSEATNRALVLVTVELPLGRTFATPLLQERTSRIKL